MRTPGCDLRQDRLFVGRSEELSELVRNLRRGRHTLLVGEKGIGKTRLMMEARWVITGRKRRIDLSARLIAGLHGRLSPRFDPGGYRIVSVERACPMGDCLEEIAAQLHRYGDIPAEADEERTDWTAVKKRLRSAGRNGLEAAVFEGISRSETPYLVFLDSLDRITAGQQRFFETLLAVAVVCAAVVRPKEAAAFRRVWASFARIELEPLPDRACLELIDHLFRTYPFRLSDRELYRREVLKSSHGNPFHIKNMMYQALREGYLGEEEIRKLRRIEEGRYFNMGPLYIFAIAVFTLFKIFSIGTSDREFYIYFSALGFLAYMVFRVFRAFFIFRPQKER